MRITLLNCTQIVSHSVSIFLSFRISGNEATYVLAIWFIFYISRWKRCDAAQYNDTSNAEARSTMLFLLFFYYFFSRGSCVNLSVQTSGKSCRLIQWNLYDWWVSAAKKDRKIYEFLNSSAPMRGPPFSNSENSTVEDHSRYLFVATRWETPSARSTSDTRQKFKHYFFSQIARTLLWFFAKLRMIQHSFILYCRLLFLSVTKRINLVIWDWSFGN